MPAASYLLSALQRGFMVAVNFCRDAFTALISFLSYIASQTSTAIDVSEGSRPSSSTTRSTTNRPLPFVSFASPALDDVICQRRPPPFEERAIWLVESPLTVDRPLHEGDQLPLLISLGQQLAEALAELVAPVYEDPFYILFLGCLDPFFYSPPPNHLSANMGVTVNKLSSGDGVVSIVLTAMVKINLLRQM